MHASSLFTFKAIPIPATVAQSGQNIYLGIREDHNLADLLLPHEKRFFYIFDRCCPTLATTQAHGVDLDLRREVPEHCWQYIDHLLRPFVAPQSVDRLLVPKTELLLTAARFFYPFEPRQTVDARRLLRIYTHLNEQPCTEDQLPVQAVVYECLQKDLKRHKLRPPIAREAYRLLGQVNSLDLTEARPLFYEYLANNEQLWDLLWRFLQRNEPNLPFRVGCRQPNL